MNTADLRILSSMLLFTVACSCGTPKQSVQTLVPKSSISPTANASSKPTLGTDVIVNPVVPPGETLLPPVSVTPQASAAEKPEVPENSSHPEIFNLSQLTDTALWETEPGCLSAVSEAKGTQVGPMSLAVTPGQGQACGIEEIPLSSPTGIRDGTQFSGGAQKIENEGIQQQILLLRVSKNFVYPGTYPHVNLFLNRYLNLKRNPILTLRLKAIPFVGERDKVRLQFIPIDANGNQSLEAIEVGADATLQDKTLNFSSLNASNCVSATAQSTALVPCDFERVRSLLIRVFPILETKPVTLDYATRTNAQTFEEVTLDMSEPSKDFSVNSAVRLKVKTLSGTGNRLRLDLYDARPLSTNAMPIDFAVADTGESILDYNFTGKFLFRDSSQNPVPPDSPVHSSNIQGLSFFLNPGNTNPGKVTILEATKGKMTNGVFEPVSPVQLCFSLGDWEDPNSRVSCDPTLRWSGQIQIVSLRQTLAQKEPTLYAGARIRSHKIPATKSTASIDCRMSFSALQP